MHKISPYLKQTAKWNYLPLCLTALALLHRLVIDIVYKVIISPNFLYAGFDLSGTTAGYMESWVYTLVMIWITPKNEKRLSSVFLQIQLAIMLIPMLSLYGLSSQSRVFLLCACGCHALQVAVLHRPPADQKLHITEASRSVRYGIYAMVGLVVAASVVLNGLPSLSVFDFTKIYEARSNVVLPFPFSYFVNWVAKIMLPFLVVYFLDKKRYLLSAAFCVLQVLMFMFYAQKAYLLIIFAILGVYILCRLRLLLLGMYGGLIVGSVASSIMYLVNPSWLYPVSLMVRRLMFLPAQLKFRYYDFFSVYPKVHFADGIIGSILNITSPYENNIPGTIALHYEGRLHNANTGYWGDAYANAGFAGVILLSLLLAVIFLLMERFCKNLATPVVIAAAFFSIISLNDGALLTNLLTGGMLVLVVVYYFFDADEFAKNNLLKNGYRSPYIKAPVLLPGTRGAKN